VGLAALRSGQLVSIVLDRSSSLSGLSWPSYWQSCWEAKQILYKFYGDRIG